MIVLHTRVKRLFIICLFLLLSSMVLAQSTDELMITLWSPDGEMIATGSFAGHLRIWNKDGTLVLHQMRDGAVSTISWSADSTRIALPRPENKVHVLNVTLATYSVG